MDADTPLSETTRLLDWRYLELRKLGLSTMAAEDLCELPDVAHQAQTLIAAGCPPRLAYRILRPFV